MNMRYYIIICVSLAFTVLSANVQAQGNLFLFTMMPSAEVEPYTFIHYDVAYGRQTFEPLGADNLEQNLGIQSKLGETFTFAAHIGLDLGNDNSTASQQGELLARLLNEDNNPVDFSAGLGYRHEYSGTSVLLSRFIVGRQFDSWGFYGNLLFEHAFAANRNDIDLMTSIGLSHNFSNMVQIGVEAVGQNIEGFWTPDEAEGGAVVFVGPSANILFPGTSYSLVIGGGPIIHATYSPVSSSAYRELPDTRGNGFVVRTMLRFGL